MSFDYSVKPIFGQLAGMSRTTPLGPKAEHPVSFASSRSVDGMSMPGKNPFGQISPNMTNENQANKLPRLYA